MSAGNRSSEPAGADEQPAEAARRQQRLREQVARLAFLREAGRALGSTLDLGEVTSRAVELARRTTGADSGGLLLLDEQGQVTVVIPSVRGRPAGIPAPVIRRVLEQGLAAWTARRRRGTVVLDTRTDSRWIDLRESMGNIRSVLSVPLPYQDQLRGILVLTHPRPGHFTPSHLDLLSAAAPQIANALENARLYRTVAQDRAQMQAILTNLTDALFVLDAAGKVILANPTLERLMGRSVAELLGRPFDQVIPLEYGRRPNPIQGVLQGRFASFEMDLWLRSAASEEIPVRVGGACLLGDQDQPNGAVVILRDTRYLREIEGMREDLVHMLVHDLKAPLASIISSAAVLQQYPLGRMGQDLAQELLGIVEKSAWRLARMVEAILDVQRLEAGQFPLSVAPLQLQQVVDEVMEEVTPLAQENEVETRVDWPVALPPVAADREVVHRILWNLLDNALKYTPQRGLILVTAREVVSPAGTHEMPPLQDLPPGRWVILAVTDTGPGIPPEDQERIFAKFTQARVGRGRRRGMGLGLAFCRLAVEAHGGCIWVESHLGTGSTFSFALPVAAPSADRR